MGCNIQTHIGLFEKMVSDNEIIRLLCADRMLNIGDNLSAKPFIEEELERTDLSPEYRAALQARLVCAAYIGGDLFAAKNLASRFNGNSLAEKFGLLSRSYEPQPKGVIDRPGPRRKMWLNHKIAEYGSWLNSHRWANKPLILSAIVADMNTAVGQYNSIAKR